MKAGDVGEETAAAQIYLGVTFTALGFALIAFFHRYADRDLMHWHSYVSLFLAYASAVGLLLVLPLDLTLTRLRREANTLELFNTHERYAVALISLYKGLYWPMLLSGNLVLVVLDEYNDSGYFSFLSKALDAVVQLCKQLAMAAVAGLAFILLLVIEAKADSVGVISITLVALSNTYGLMAIAFLLGFGLMEMPKFMWKAGDLFGRVRRAQAKAAHEYRRLDDASLDVSEIVGSINQTKSAIGRKDHHLQACVDELLADVPEGVRGAGGEAQLNKVTGQVTVHELAWLRRRLHYKLRSYFCAKAKIEHLKEECFYLEDVLAAFVRGQGYITWLNGQETGTLGYLWEAWWKPLGLRLLGVACLGMSVLVMLGEVGLFAGAKSPIAGLTKAVRESAMGDGSFTILVLFSLGFLVYVLIFALFQLRLSNMMEIVPGKKTNRASLSFNARLFCQFAAPLAYNYLGLTLEAGPTIQHAPWMDSKATGLPVATSFSSFYGKLNIVPFLGDNINLLMPILIIIIAVLHGFNVLNTLLQYLRLGALQFGDIPISKEELEVGEAKLKRAREVAQRAATRDQRRKELGRGLLNMRIDLRLATSPSGLGMAIYNLCRRKPTQRAEGEHSDTEHLSVEIPSDLMELPDVHSANSTPGLSPAGSPTSADLKALDAILPRDPRILERYAQLKLMRVMSKPEPRRGYAEKKAHKVIAGVVGRGWQKRYFLLRDPGVLSYYEHEEDVSVVEDPKWEVDIKDIGEPTLHASDNGTIKGHRVNVPLPKEDDILKLKFKNDDDAMEWLTVLVSWKQWVDQQEQQDQDQTSGGQNRAAPPSTTPTELIAPPSPVSSGAPSPKNYTVRGGLMGMLTRTAKASTPPPLPPKIEIVVEPTPEPVDPRPLPHKGWLSKKSSNHTQTWNDRYFVLDRDDPCLRYYYGVDMGEVKGQFDMRDALRVQPYAKGSKADPSRFVVVFKGRDNKLKLKAETAAEAEEWQKVLEAWIEYHRGSMASVTSTVPTFRTTAVPSNLLD